MKLLALSALLLIGIIFLSGCVNQQTSTVTSTTQPTSTTITNQICGNGFCESTETCTNCNKDCGLCQKLIIQSASCNRTINPNAEPVLGEECGVYCPRFTVLAVVYNPNDYATVVRYGYFGSFVNAYTDKRNTGTCSNIVTYNNFPACALIGPVTIPAKSATMLNYGNLDLLYTGPDVQLSYIKISYSTDLNAGYQGSETVETDPYALIC